jgi:hypothetical protein
MRRFGMRSATRFLLVGLRATEISRSGETSRQVQRQRACSSKGRYVSNPCDLCGRGVAFGEYVSWEHCNEHGLGVLLHEECAAKLDELSEGEALALLREAWGRQ